MRWIWYSEGNDYREAVNDLDWEAQFQPQIVDRGFDYYCRGLVTDGQKSAHEIRAVVTGTRRYHVALTIEEEVVTSAECDCPYAAEGKYCKHMAAVLFWAFGDDDQPEDLLEEHGLSVPQLMAAASEQQVRDFLTSLLQRNGQLATQFELVVAPEKAGSHLTTYRNDVRAICDSYMDEDDFIDYRQAGAFEDELSTFIQTHVQLAVDQQQTKVAFKQLTVTVLILADLDIDDSDGELMLLDEVCHDLWEQVIAQANLPLQRQIFTWLTVHANGTLQAFEESVTDLVFAHFTAAEFMQAKLTWTAQRLQTAKQRSEDWEVGEWATRHLDLMIDLKAAPADIAQFCSDNANYSTVRQAYVKYCLDRNDYATALEQLLAGKRQAQGMRYQGLLSRYSRQLTAIYQHLGKTTDYRRELWQLETVYDPADLTAFRELKRLYSTADWPDQRKRLFAALPQRADVAPLYAEEGLLRQLLQVVLAQPGLTGVQTYADILKPKFSAQLLDKYVAVVEQMVAHTGTRKHYQAIVGILNDMTAYPLGSNEANRLIKTWRVKYDRRSAMLDELHKFKG